MSSRWDPRGLTSSQGSRASIDLRDWTSLLVMMKGVRSGTLAMKSAMGVFGGVRRISMKVNWDMVEE